MSPQAQLKRDQFRNGLSVSFEGSEQVLGGEREIDATKATIRTGLKTDTCSTKPGQLIVVDFTGEMCQVVDRSDWEKPYAFDVFHSSPELEDKFAIIASNYAIEQIRLIKNFCVDNEEIMN